MYFSYLLEKYTSIGSRIFTYDKLYLYSQIPPVIAFMEISPQIQELITYYSSLEERFDLFFSVEKGTFVTGSIKHVYNALKQIKDEFKIFSENELFMDAGSGDGRVCALASLMNLKSFGIEYNDQITADSLENIKLLKQKGLFKQATVEPPKIVQGDLLDDSSYEKLGITFEEVDVFFNFVTYHQELSEQIIQRSPSGTRLILHSPCPTSFAPEGLELLCEIPLTGIYHVIYVFQKP